MKDFVYTDPEDEFGGVLCCSDTVNIDRSIKFDIPKLCAYIREEKKKGRTNDDITLEEVKHLMLK